MRTTSILTATGVAAALLLAGVGCSKTEDAAAPPTTVASAKSDGNTGGDGDGGGGSSTGSASLPAEWPAELAIPDGVTVTDAATITSTASVVNGTVDGDPEAVLDAFESQLTDGGWTIVQSNFTPSDKGGFGGISATSATQTVAISLGPDSTGSFTTLTINLAGKDT